MGILYKFVCFDCLLAFKRRATKHSDVGSAWLGESELVHNCPNCGHRMAFLGRNFRAPKQSEKSKWKSAQLLWEAGYRYCGSGYHEDPPLPESKASTIEFIENNSNHIQRVAGQNCWGKYT